MTKILFLDLDGTVRRTKSGATFISDPYDQELIPGVEDAIARYHDWVIVGVTNQGGVAAGFKSLGDCIAEQYRTLELIPQMRWILFCPDDGISCKQVSKDIKLGGKFYAKDKDKKAFRKPNPGMIHCALDVLFREEYSKSTETLMVGDRSEDEQCAKNANIPFMWAEDWRK